MIICPVCGFRGEPTRQYTAIEKIVSCPHCGIIIMRASFPLDPLTTQAVRA